MKRGHMIPFTMGHICERLSKKKVGETPNNYLEAFYIIE
jgi:hypothetical protein